MNFKKVFQAVAGTVLAAVILTVAGYAISVPSKFAVTELRQDSFEKRLDKFETKQDEAIRLQAEALGLLRRMARRER